MRQDLTPPAPQRPARARSLPTLGGLLALLFLSVLVSTHLAAAEGNPLEAEVDTSITLLRNLDFPVGERVAYEEVQQNPMLKAPVSQQGYVEISKDGELRMQVISPRPELRRLHQGTLSLQRPSKRAVKRNPETALATAPVRSLTLNPDHSGHLVLLAITQVLEGNLQALHQHFTLAQLPSPPSQPWRLRLTPKSHKVQKRLLHIELTGIGNQLQGFYTQRSEQAWQRLTFHPANP